MLQSLRGGVDEGGGEGGVVPFDHGAPGYHHAVGGAGVRQLPEMGHHVGHGERRVGVQGDGRDLKLLIAKTGSVESLEGGKKRRRCKLKKEREERRERMEEDKMKQNL